MSTDPYAVVMLACAMLAVLTFVVFYVVLVGRVRRQTQRYPLFAVRDEFVRLKARGAFSADPALYDYYVGLCNLLIRNTRHMNLRLLINAVQRVTPDGVACVQEMEKRTESAPPGVKEAADRLYAAVIDLLKHNSTLVRVVASDLGRAVGRIAFASARRQKALSCVGRVSPYTERAVEEYKEVRDMKGRLSLVA